MHFVNFRKSYHQTPILKISDLDFTPGIYWIKGANGTGKSTLLRAAAGIIDFEGDIILESGVSLKNNPVGFKQLVNFAEAEPLFPAFLRGRELVSMFASAKAAPPGMEIEFVSSMDMDSWIGDPIGTYSSGMVKKLSLLLAFLGNPKYILLDEPLITIDTDSLPILYQWINETHRKNKVTFLLSSHQSLELNGLEQVRNAVVEAQTVKIVSA